MHTTKNWSNKWKNGKAMLTTREEVAKVMGYDPMVNDS